MRLLFLVHGADGVSGRFRVQQYVPSLRQRGWQVDSADLRVPLQARWRLLQSAHQYDAVCVHRAFLNPLEYRLLRRAARHLVFDFDDAIMLRDSAHRRLPSRQRRWRFRRMVTGADVVVAGNAYLAQWAARYASDVRIIPTTVDLTAYPSARDGAVPASAVVGWIGTRVNLMYLERIAPALARLAKRHAGMRVKLVADGSIDLPGVEVIEKRWSLADEVADLLSFRIGIMPLADDAWTRGKCGLKILQYFAAGLPVVCSPVGTNLEIVQPGLNGYFATTTEEWTARLDDLLRHPETCTAFGAAGRRTVEQRYSIDANIDLLMQALRPEGCAL